MTSAVGRPVRVTSIGFPQLPLDDIVSVVDREGARGTDLIALPELCRGWDPEPLEGPTVSAMSGLARKHGTYIVCPIDRLDGARRLNSAVLVERDGRVACVYDKIYPYWGELTDISPAASPGGEMPVYQADFGRVAMAICFDVNFPELWEEMSAKGCELVIWPSAYSAGMSLYAHSLMYHYYIVTCTQRCDCIICDITGEEMLYERGEGINVTRATLDLDRCLFHLDFNPPKLERLLADHGDDVEVERTLDREGWFLLRAKRSGVSARELAREYGMEELRDYISRSLRQIDEIRGAPFVASPR